MGHKKFTAVFKRFISRGFVYKCVEYREINLLNTAVNSRGLFRGVSFINVLFRKVTFPVEAINAINPNVSRMVLDSTNISFNIG